MLPKSDPVRGPSATTVGAVLLAVLLFVRLVTLPSDASATASFSHDSGYIGIVARNLVAGRGFVNDAHWLLFLDPNALPMPYHNANPGYPVATAAVMRIAGIDAARGMLVVSALGAALIGIGSWGIARCFTHRRWAAVLAGAMAIALPATFRITMSALPDALATGLVLCFFAMLLHARRPWHWVGAGVLFGLAWLVRSTAVLALPAVAVWSLARFGLLNSVRRGAMVAVAAAVVMSPWLVHTARVRGKPFASDAGHYLLLRYHAAKMGRVEDQYYRSLSPPPSTGEAFQADPVGVVHSAATGLPEEIYKIVAELAIWDVSVAVLMFLAILAGAIALWRSPWRPEVAAAGLVWLVLLAALAIRGNSAEVRYYSVGSALLGMLLIAPLTRLGSRRVPWLAIPLVAYLLIGVVPQNAAQYRLLNNVNRDRVAVRRSMMEIAATMPDTSRAISHVPYFFTYWTGRGAISPAYPGKRELLYVMKRYDASVVLLPTDSVGYYYPGGSSALQPELTPGDPLGRLTLFHKKS